MEEVIKRCDFPVGRGNNVKPHAEVIEDAKGTPFRIGGIDYEADLCPQHKQMLLDAVAPFVKIARRTGSAMPRNAKGRAVMRAKGGVLFTTKDVRKWLEEQGDSVPATGRIPNADIEKYKAAHGLA